MSPLRLSSLALVALITTGVGPCEAPLNTCQAYPTCDEGHEEIEDEGACLQDDAVCYERSLCGYSSWCTGPASSCAPLACAPEEVAIDSDEDGCTDTCVAPEECEAFPSCDEGHQAVASATECLQDDAVCYERSLCGSTIWCTGPASS